MHQRAALAAREHGGVEFLFQLFVGAGQDQAATWTAQGLVGGSGDHVGERNRVRVQAGSHQTGNVGHIDKEISADFVSDLTEAREIQGLGVSGEAGDDHFRLVFDRQALDFVVVDQAGVGVDAVLHRVVELAGEADLGTVGQVPAVGQAHAQYGIAGLQQGQIDRRVGLAAGVRLDVGIVGAEQLLGALDGQGFDLVDVLATAVVTLARITFGVFVGQAAALGFHDALAGVVL
ncbi:hypothetical protein D3C78_880990 [compost metagenome]